MAGLSGGLVVFYVATYAVHRFPVPIGWDAPGYVWRTRLASVIGFSNLPVHFQPPGPVHAGRPAFVMVAGLLSPIVGRDPMRLAMVIPGVLAVAIGLAAGVLYRTLLRRPAWEAGLVAAGVGTSAFVVHLVNVEGYLDGTIAAAIFLAALTPIAMAVPDRAPVPAALLLLTAAALAHWNFFSAVAAVLGLAMLALVPWQRAARDGALGHGGAPWGPVLRIASIGAGAAGLAVIVLFTVYHSGFPKALLTAGQFSAKLQRDVPAYAMGATLLAATVGAVWIAGRVARIGSLRSRSGVLLVLLVAWCEVTLLGFVAQRVLDRAIPTHRLLAFDLAIPILAVAGVLWLGRRVASWSRVAAAVLVLGVLAWQAVGAFRSWSSFRPVMSSDQARQAATAASYLSAARVPVGTPIVFVLDQPLGNTWQFAWLAGHSIRAGLPGKRVADAFFYIGPPEQYLAGRAGSPTALVEAARAGTISDAAVGRYAAASASYFGAMASTYARDPVAILLASASSDYPVWVSDHPGAEVGPGVAIVRGPSVTPVAAAPIPVGPLGAGGLVALGLAMVAILVFVGWGWAGTLIGSRLSSGDLLGWAPAVGMGMLILGGSALDAIGLHPGGVSGLIASCLIAALGWAGSGIRRIVPPIRSHPGGLP